MNRPLTLDQADALVPDIAGTKAAVLARLRMAGLRVPPGLVLPSAAATTAGNAAVRSFAEAVVARFDGPVAVRTSAPWEDLATAARAGETVTHLHVEGVGAIADAVAHALEEARLLAPDAVGAAVLVQPMLSPSSAGVAFSADPVTGERDVVRIAAVEGVADRLVAGEEDGVDVTVRGRQLHGDPGAIPRADLLAVAETVQQVALLMGGPQDVEWAVANGAVHVLQARPITVLPVRPVLPEGNGWQKDVAHYSEPLTPFGGSALLAAGVVVAEVFGAAGLLVDGLEERFVGGEMYGRVVPAIGKADPGPRPSAPPPAALLGVAARLVPALRRRSAAASRLLHGGLLEAWQQEWDDARPRLVARTDALRRTELSALDDEALVEHLRSLQDTVLEGTRLHFQVMVPFMLAAHQLHRVLEDLPGWTAGATASLLAGASPTTTESAEEMAPIRSAVARVPGAIAALRARHRDPVGALAELAPDASDRLAAWIDRHGWRAMNYDAGAPVLAERPWAITRLLLADPAVAQPRGAKVVADEVRSLVGGDRLGAFEAALATARECYGLREDSVVVGGDVPLGLMRRWLLDAGARLADRGVLPTVADAAYLRPDEMTNALRGRLGSSAAIELVVRRRGEAAWVRANPGPMYVGAQGGAPPDVSAMPADLRRVNEAVLWFIGLEYPEPAEDTDGRADDEALVHGVAGSPGVAEGPVRVVRDHDDLDGLADGEVLVCQVTSPGWVPLFPLAAAIVTDGGGAMSHAAIAAREHGLPAVLGTGVATTTLRNGQVVRVDGTAGTVAAGTAAPPERVS